MNKKVTQGLPWLRLCASTARGTGLIPGNGTKLNNKPDSCLNGGSLFALSTCLSRASLMAQMVKNLPAIQETWV